MPGTIPFLPQRTFSNDSDETPRFKKIFTTLAYFVAAQSVVLRNTALADSLAFFLTATLTDMINKDIFTYKKQNLVALELVSIKANKAKQPLFTWPTC